jgi:hypothetical protein
MCEPLSTFPAFLFLKPFSSLTPDVKTISFQCRLDAALPTAISPTSQRPQFFRTEESLTLYLMLSCCRPSSEPGLGLTNGNKKWSRPSRTLKSEQGPSVPCALPEGLMWALCTQGHHKCTLIWVLGTLDPHGLVGGLSFCMWVFLELGEGGQHPAVGQRSSCPFHPPPSGES